MKKSFIPKAVKQFLMLDVYDRASDSDKKFLNVWMFAVKLAFAPNKLINLITQIIVLMVKKIRK